MYPIQRVSRSEFVPIRRLNYHVRLWGHPETGTPPLVLLHGWMDVAASFQFMVDTMARERFIIAPDWRGFGLTASGGADCFWWPDYLADLDALLDHYVADQTIDLVGHSMGGNVAMLYAGVRPARIRHLINLEGFGMPATRPSQAPGRLTHWLDELQKSRLGATRLKPYPSLDAVADRLTKNNPRLTRDKALWLAGHWAVEHRPGEWTILGEPAHKIVNAQLYNVDEVLAVHRQISAPTLMVEASHNEIAKWWQDQLTLTEHHERLKVVTQLERVTLPDCGHMLHHDQPQALAELIENFLAPT